MFAVDQLYINIWYTHQNILKQFSHKNNRYQHKTDTQQDDAKQVINRNMQYK